MRKTRRQYDFQRGHEKSNVEVVAHHCANTTDTVGTTFGLSSGLWTICYGCF